MKPKLASKPSEKKKSILIPQRVAVAGHVRNTPSESIIIDPFFKTVDKLAQIMVKDKEVKDKKIQSKPTRRIRNLREISPTLKKTINEIDTIPNIDNLSPVSNDNTSGVYTTKINGDTHYFKPTLEEKYYAMVGEDDLSIPSPNLSSREGENLKLRFFRDGIKKDNLGERELLSYETSKLFGLDFIPPTRMVKTENGETGTLQLSSHLFEKRKTPDKDVILDPEPAITKEIMKKIVDNGNILDVALFDFIIGNTDRHSGNIFLKTSVPKKIDDKSKLQYDLSPIDHGLSFPVHKENEITPDYTNSMSFLWDFIINPAGKNAKISDDFLDALSNKGTYKGFEKILANSSIEPEAKKAALFRLKSTMDIIKTKNKTMTDLNNPEYNRHITPNEKKLALDKNGKFSSEDFKKLLDTFMENGIRNAKSGEELNQATVFKDWVDAFEFQKPFDIKTPQRAPIKKEPLGTHLNSEQQRNFNKVFGT